MTDCFLTLLEMSLSASWLVLAVIAARFLLKKAPRWLTCGLWSLVALRLICPFSFESTISLIPEFSLPPTIVEETLPERVENIVWDASSTSGDKMSVAIPDQQGIPVVYEVYLSEDGTTKPVAPRQIPLAWPRIATSFWLAGMAVLLLYAAVSYLRIWKKVQASIDLGHHVFLCDYIQTPFILGILRPQIFLPSEMDPRDAAHVLAHERAHLKRRDHLWKPLGFVLLSLHWFNPLLWVAYILLCRDIELACDERVIKTMGKPEKKAYSEALLKCSVPRHMILACPLAFGEVGVKQRIQSVLDYRKPSFWVLAVGFLVTIVIGVCFLTEQPKAELTSPFEESLWATDLIYSYSGEPLYHGPSELLDTIMLTESTGISTISTYRKPFSEISLTETNFDILFEDTGEWYSKSAEKLRQQNVNAWVLHDTHSDTPNKVSHYFFYLLQQKNGDLYLTYGRWWDAQLRPGKTRINWVIKLEKAAVTRPFADGETPYVYTRTINTQYLTGHGWHPLTVSQENVNIDDYQIWIPQLIDILHCVPENAISLGNPIENVECAIDLDVENSDIFDVQLRYGEGKVEMRFHEESTWSFANTGDKVWIIDNEDLNLFFARYSPSYQMPDYLQQPLDIHQWKANVDADDFEWAHVYIVTPLRHNYGYSMDSKQLKDLLRQMKTLPDSAFVPTIFEEDVFQMEDSRLINLLWYHPVSMDDSDHICAVLEYADGHLYFSFDAANQKKHLQTWEIQDSDFVTYLEQFFDPMIPHDFHTTEAVTGTISTSHEDASIQLNTYEYMDYEIIEYTDEETPFGIRMRPKMMDSGWISVLYYPNGFIANEGWSSAKGSMGDHKVFWYTSEEQSAYNGINTWTAIEFIDLPGDPGDYVIINDGLDTWMAEYYFDSSTIFDGMKLANME